MEARSEECHERVAGPQRQLKLVDPQFARLDGVVRHEAMNAELFERSCNLRSESPPIAHVTDEQVEGVCSPRTTVTGGLVRIALRHSCTCDRLESRWPFLVHVTEVLSHFLERLVISRLVECPVTSAAVDS